MKVRNKEKDKARNDHQLGQKIQKELKANRAARWSEISIIHDESSQMLLAMAQEHENYTKGLLPFITEPELLKEFETLMQGLAIDLNHATVKLISIRKQWIRRSGFIKDDELIKAYGIADQYQQANEEFACITGNTMVAIGDIANSVNRLHGGKDNEEQTSTEQTGEINATQS